MRQLKIITAITNRDSQSTEKYLQDISKFDMITPEEETKLAVKRKMYNPGSKEYQEAVDSLVNANLRFVVSVAKQYQHQGLSLSDLINEGNLGLIKAAQRFDETKGFKFISYAVWRIRQSILQALAEQGRLVRIPQNKIGVTNKISKAIQSFEQEHERFPSDDELAEILDMNPGEIASLLASNMKHTSLDEEKGGSESDGITLGDMIEGDSQEIFSVFTFGNNDERTESIKAFLKAVKLPPREEEILLAYFGFDGLAIEHMEQKYDLTRERVRQIKERALVKIKKRAAALNHLRDDIIIPETPKKNTTDNTWLREKTPLGKPLQEGDLVAVDKVILTTNNSSNETGHKGSKKNNIRRKTQKQLVKQLDSTPTKGKESHDTINNEVHERLDVILQQLSSLDKSVNSYIKSGLSATDETIIVNIQQQLKTTQDVVAIYNKQTTRDTIAQNKINLATSCINSIRLVIQKHIETTTNSTVETPSNTQDEYSTPQSGNDTAINNFPEETIDLTSVDERKAENEKKIIQLIQSEYNWETQLKNSEYNDIQKTCIRTLLHYYGETSGQGRKSVIFDEILKGAKLRSGMIINQQSFNEYIFDFIDTIVEL